MPKQSHRAKKHKIIISYLLSLKKLESRVSNICSNSKYFINKILIYLRTYKIPWKKVKSKDKRVCQLLEQLAWFNDFRLLKASCSISWKLCVNLLLTLHWQCVKVTPLLFGNIFFSLYIMKKWDARKYNICYFNIYRCINMELLFLSFYFIYSTKVMMKHST